MNKTIQIRLAKDMDFEAIFSIWLEGLHNSFETSQMDLQKINAKFSANFFQRQGIFNFWVAEDRSGNILGWQSLIKTSNNPFRENSYAESSTYISKENRGHGVGKLLLDFVMKKAEKSELEYVFGFVTTTNEAGRKITKDTGWVEVGQIPVSKKGDSGFPKTFLVRPV